MSFPARYEQVISYIVGLCPAPDKFAHTYAGLILWLAAAMIGRWSLRSPLPLAVVMGAEIANEIIDRFAHGSWMWHDTLTDMLATWFWPFCLMVALRAMPRLADTSST